MMDKIIYYLQYPFVQYAFIVGTLIALCSSLLGVTLVSRKLSFIGDSLSHVAFLISAVAGAARLTFDLWITMAITIAFTVILMGRKNSSEKSDAHLALISVSSLAAGYMTMNLFGKGSNVSADVCTTLFGSTSILTLTKNDVYLSVVMSLGVIVCFILCYNQIFTITFDERFADVSGVKTTRYNRIIAVIIAVVIVLAMNLVGSLLITALIVFPTLCAMSIFRSFKSVTICTAILSVLSAGTGILVSILSSTPVGSTIVMIDLFMYLIFSFLGRFRA